MNDPNPRPRPPIICETCYAHQIHHVADVDHVSYYCEHREAWVVWDGTKWQVRQPVTVDQHAAMIRGATVLAVALTAMRKTGAISDLDIDRMLDDDARQ